MATINELATISASQLNGADNLPVYSSQNGDARKMSLTALLAYFQTVFTKQDYVTSRLTPADGFTATIEQDGFSRWLLLRPTTSLNTGTIVLPASNVATDGQEILVTTTYQIASLTINGNGATSVYGAPSNLSAEDKFTLRFDSLSSSWYCIK